LVFDSSNRVTDHCTLGCPTTLPTISNGYYPPSITQQKNGVYVKGAIINADCNFLGNQQISCTNGIWVKTGGSCM
jgi:hypothetical protein